MSAKGMFDEVLENVGEPFTGGGKGFEYGTHEVLIMEAEPKTKQLSTTPEAAVIEVTVCDKVDQDKAGHATLYFHTEGGAKMAVAKVLGIMVHNVGEEKKDAVRALGKKLFSGFSNTAEDRVKSRDVAVKLINEKMIGKEAYFVAEPRGNYKTTAYGDIWHYPAEPQGQSRDEAEQVAKVTGGAVADVAESEIPDFGEDL